MKSTRHFKWSSNRELKRRTDLELCAGV
jgi:hypothetical protein